MFRRFSWLLVSFLFSAALVSGLKLGQGHSQASEHTAGVIISEVAWGGTIARGTDEWVELYNNDEEPVVLTGWSLGDGNDIEITLHGTIPAHGFFLLERSDDNTIIDIPADQIFTGSLNNLGENLVLVDGFGLLVDTANSDGGPWPAGSGSPDHLSMERLGASLPDEDANWISNDTITRNGHDIDWNPINGTPDRENSSWDLPEPEPDLVMDKAGPSVGMAGSTLRYNLSLGNTGTVTATGVILTDTLPIGLNYLGDNSNLPLTQLITGTLVWQVGAVTTRTLVTFQLTVTVEEGLSGTIINVAQASTTLPETNTANNFDQVTTIITGGGTPSVLIDAILYDSYELGDADEAVRLINVGDAPADLSGWRLSDGSTVAIFPDGSLLESGEVLWISKNASAFARQFGHTPGYEVSDSDPNVPDLLGTWPGFTNDGDEVLLYDSVFLLQDAAVYESGNVTQAGWSGPALQPYLSATSFAAEGQILYRKRDQGSALPVPDTNTAEDWAQSTDDIVNGRKVLYPGWVLNSFFFTTQVTETAELIIAIAPDNAYEAIVTEIDSAQSRIDILSHGLSSMAITDALVGAINRGITVTILMEGGPAGGITDQERLVCKRLEEAGGQCWFMINDSNQRIFDRYRYLHAKFVLVDGQRVIISSENLSPDSLPNDDKSDGTWGRRGVILVTDAVGVVERVRAIWEADFDPANHVDLFRWTAEHPVYGNPPPGTQPITRTGGTTYTVRYGTPSITTGQFAFEVIQSPENSLRDQDSLLGLLSRANTGDTVLVQQLSEQPHWGGSTSNANDDPNPRLEAYIDAARRGARVRLLLDKYFDDNSNNLSNQATCVTVGNIANEERLDLQCATANPSGLGIHNKMILAHIDGHGFIHVGSINGTELSSKGNRELALQLQSDEAYRLLAELFTFDWPHLNWLPAIFRNYAGRADYELIGEVLYDPVGLDDAEFIEIVNPTASAINISHFGLGDAVYPTDNEDLRRFPAGTFIGPYEAIIVAYKATAFKAQFGFNPNFEIAASDPAVPDLIDDPAWGHPSIRLRLANEGDEVILRDAFDQIVDGIAYGSGNLPGVSACPLVSDSGYSLERFPYWKDTDDCSADFKEQASPNPGTLN